MRDRTMFGNKAGNSIDRRAFNDTEILFKELEPPLSSSASATR